MKKYVIPKLDVVELPNCDAIRTSLNVDSSTVVPDEANGDIGIGTGSTNGKW